MPDIKSTITSMIRAREVKIRSMQDDFEPTQRISRYKQDSLASIKKTYRDLMQRTAAELLRKQGEVEQRFHVEALDADTRTRELIRAGALPTRDITSQARGILGSGLPFHPERALILSKELRQRNEPELADRLAQHAVGFLEKPWTAEGEYQTLSQYRGRCETFAANADAMIILSLDPKENAGDILTIDNDGTIRDPHVPGGEQREADKRVLSEAVNGV